MPQQFVQAPLNKQRKDKYLIVIPVPKGLREMVGGSSDRANSKIIPEALTMSIYGSVTPDIVVPPLTQGYAGQHYSVSSLAREAYPPMNINFTIDNRFNNWWVIYKWLNILNDEKKSEYDTKNTTDVQHKNEVSSQYYMTNISIFALDEYNKRVIEFKYHLAYPTKLGGITFSDRDPGEAEATLEFAYSQFTAELVESVESL